MKTILKIFLLLFACSYVYLKLDLKDLIKPSKTTSSDSEHQDTVNYYVGDTVTVEDVDFTVIETEIKKTIGKPSYNKTALDNYYLVCLTVTNNKNKPISISSNYFKLFRQEKEYEYDVATNLYLSLEDKEDFFMTNLNPESTFTGWVAFDISDDACVDEDLRLQVKPELFGSKKAEIYLNKTPE